MMSPVETKIGTIKCDNCGYKTTHWLMVNSVVEQTYMSRVGNHEAPSTVRQISSAKWCLTCVRDPQL